MFGGEGGRGGDWEERIKGYLWENRDKSGGRKGRRKDQKDRDDDWAGNCVGECGDIVEQYRMRLKMRIVRQTDVEGGGRIEG
ncbi:hypothetical protein Tco_1254242 [Tanacetum coccineum]|uniref:Uncharacterized protein n=1 Tax=Tanacetum coccineum TaxID=301880 RepID=A0ABQ5GDP5_9ASTR